MLPCGNHWEQKMGNLDSLIMGKTISLGTICHQVQKSLGTGNWEHDYIIMANTIPS